MMFRAIPLLPIVLVLLGCQTNPDKQTISQLRDVPPDLSEVYIDDSLLKALSSYRQFLNETPQHTMAPEAMPISPPIPVAQPPRRAVAPPRVGINARG